MEVASTTAKFVLDIKTISSKNLLQSLNKLRPSTKVKTASSLCFCISSNALSTFSNHGKTHGFLALYYGHFFICYKTNLQKNINP